MFDFFRRTPTEQKSAPALGANMFALSLGGRAHWGARDTVTLARTGVMQNAVANRCVRMIATAAASVPWLLYDGPMNWKVIRC